MELANTLVGLPWQLVEPILRAAYIPFTTVVGKAYNKHFEIANQGLYVGRITVQNDIWEILLYYPMIYSGFESCREVRYAEQIIGKK